MPDCQVELEHPELYYPIRDLAEKSGWSKRLDSCFYKWLIIKPEEGKLTGNEKQYGDYPIISIREAVTLLKKGPTPKPPPIKIGSETVRFCSDGIMVGGQSVTTEILDEIHRRLHEVTLTTQ
jgi:hypothetical protein